MALDIIVPNISHSIAMFILCDAQVKHMSMLWLTAIITKWFGQENYCKLTESGVVYVYYFHNIMV